MIYDKRYPNFSRTIVIVLLYPEFLPTCRVLALGSLFKKTGRNHGFDIIVATKLKISTFPSPSFLPSSFTISIYSRIYFYKSLILLCVHPEDKGPVVKSTLGIACATSFCHPALFASRPQFGSSHRRLF